MAFFALSHIFSIITYEPLLSELCELIFFTTDEKLFDQMSSKAIKSSHNLSSTDIDYLSEPKPLIHCLTTLANAHHKSKVCQLQATGSAAVNLSLSSSKSRSRSVPHFSHLNPSSCSVEQLTSASIQVPTRSADSQHAQGNLDSDESELIAKLDFISPISDTGSVRCTQTMGNIAEASSETSDAVRTNLAEKNITDDEKFRQIVKFSTGSSSRVSASPVIKPQAYGIIIESILNFLNTQDYNEMNALIALSFLYTLLNNKFVSAKYRHIMSVRLSKNSSELVSGYDEALAGRLIGIVTKSVESTEFKVRLATLELAVKLIKSLTVVNKNSYVSDFHLACIEQAREQSAFVLRQKFRSEEMFLDMFEHEYQELNVNGEIIQNCLYKIFNKSSFFVFKAQSQQMNLDTLLRDWSIMLTPTSTPLSGIEFTRRFPCGDTERLKQAMRVFFLIRSLCLNLINQNENQLPLTKQEYLVKENDALDLSK